MHFVHLPILQSTNNNILRSFSCVDFKNYVLYADDDMNESLYAQNHEKCIGNVSISVHTV